MSRRPQTAIPPSQRKPRRPQTSQLEFPYGTATHYADDILRDGLRPFRRSGGTYFTPARYRAMAYAKAWGLGLHAAGLTDKPEGVILGLSFPSDTTAYVEQLHELRVDGGVPAHRVRLLERLDISDLSEHERAGHLFQFLGILGCGVDPYVDDRFQTLLDTVQRIVGQMPQGLITAGLNAVPVI